MTQRPNMAQPLGEEVMSLSSYADVCRRLC
jgi:hypothetical protein